MIDETASPEGMAGTPTEDKDPDVHIVIKESTKKKLFEHKTMEDTWDSLILKLLAVHENGRLE
jgi:hypothetical protein